MNELDSQRRELGRTVAAMKRLLHPSSIHLLHHTPHKYVSGSATLFEHGGRLFALTAAHVLPAKRPEHMSVYVFSQRAFVPMRVLNANTIPDEDVDIGYIEFEANEFAQYIADKPYVDGVDILRRPISCADIAQRVNLRVGSYMFGYPADWGEYRLMDLEAGNGYPLVQPLAFFTGFIEGRCTADHFLVSYPPEGANYGESGEPAQLPDPEGMSGGGLWQDRRPEGDVVGLRPQLVGILTHFDKENRQFVRATNIRHVMDLLHIDYPDHAFAEG
jgi:hypothetical protein